MKKPVREKKYGKKKGKTMTNEETPPATLTKKDDKNGILEIRGEQGSTGKLVIYFRHPVLAEVISKMAMGNYPGADFAKEYKTCLMPFPNPEAKGRVVSRPAIYAATKNLEAGTDFSFTAPPRGVLLANPDALRNGFEITVELTTPVPHDTLRKWAKQLMDGCSDIIHASRAFKMTWVSSPQGDLTFPGKQ